MTRQFVLPGQPTRYSRSRIFKIDHTRLELELDFESKSIRGKVSHTIEPVSRPIRYIELDAAEMTIHSAKVDDKNASFVYDNRILLTQLGKELDLNQRSTINVEYSSQPRRGLYFRVPTNEHPERHVHVFTQGQPEDSKYWYPCYDYPNMRNTTEIVVTLPASMVVVGNGKLVSTVETDSGKKKIWHFSQKIPHASYLLSLVAGEYQKVEEKHNETQLEYYFPKGRENDVQRSFSKTAKIMDFFSNVTGVKYPYAKYAQTVVSDYNYGGMENISATTLTEKTLHDERSHLDFQSDNLVSHELAHQWFGDLVTCKDWSHAWLNEGFASYFNALFREADEGVEDFQYYMHNRFMEELVEEVERYQREIVSKQYWDAEEIFDYHAYNKGAWVLHSLRGLLGDEVFWTGIRWYVSKFREKEVETFDFRKTMEEASGFELESFFNEWIFNPGFPDYKAAYSWDREKNLSRLEIEQSNAGSDGIPVFTNPIEILFTFAHNKRESLKVRMREKKESFFFSFEEEPVNVNIDPGNWILKNLKFDKPKMMHLYQLLYDGNVMERIRACHELENFFSEDVITALVRVIETDKFWGVQLEAAKALGKIGTERALEELLSMVHHKDHRVRRGIAQGLRGFARLAEKDSERAIDALIQLLENDQTYYARAYAAESLGFFKGSEKAFEAEKRALLQYSINDMIAYRTFAGFEERKDTRAIPLAIDYLQNGREFQGRAAAARALGKLGRGSNTATEALLLAKEIPDVRIRSNAATAIQYLEDPSLIPALESWLSKEPEGRCRRRLRETIFVLRERLFHFDQLSKVREQMEKLTSENKKLEERLLALEKNRPSPEELSPQ